MSALSGECTTHIRNVHSNHDCQDSRHADRAPDHHIDETPEDLTMIAILRHTREIAYKVAGRQHEVHAFLQFRMT